MFRNALFSSKMNELKKQIGVILIVAMADIRNNMENKGINASGRTSSSLKVESYDKGIRLVSSGENIAPFGTLEVGRKGSKVPKGFAQILYQWSIDKAISFDKDRERRTFAYLLARKIAREGTERHRNPRTDIYSEVIKKVVQDIENKAFVRI